MWKKMCTMWFLTTIICSSTVYCEQSKTNFNANDGQHNQHMHHSHRPPSSHTRPTLPGNPANALLLVKKEFYVRYKPATFWEAIQFCIDEGKRLASVESERDTKALMALIGPTDSKFWISGTDQGHEGRWIWLLKDEPMKYTNWMSAQPDNWNGENCLEFDGNRNGQWNDYSCENYDYYICEDSDTFLNIAGKR